MHSFRALRFALAASLAVASFSPVVVAYASSAEKPKIDLPTETKRFIPGLRGDDPESEAKNPPVKAQGDEQPPKSDVERFCSNIADAARDRRYSMQTAELETLQKDIDERIAKLEEKRAEYEDWLKKRNDFSEMAEKNLVEIYSKMKPDSAAQRLAAIDTTLAAAILMKFEPKFAGSVLNEMELKKAAILTGVIASSSRKVDPS